MQERRVVSPVTPAPAVAVRARWLPLSVGATSVLALDQLTKWWALEALDDGPIDVVGSLRFNLVFNDGGAFSVGRGATGLFIVVGLVMVAGLLWWSRRARTTGVAAALGLIVGGALGNLTDRLLRGFDGRVVDFIDLQWWPVFNVADIGLFCGAALLLIVTWREGDGADES